MKYYITIKLECCNINNSDSDDAKYTAMVVGETAAAGARDVLDNRRDAKVKSCSVEFTETVNIKSYGN
jgi:hypothetical protein